MSKIPFEVPNIVGELLGKKAKPKKRVRLTHSQRMFVWEHPEMFSRTYSICHEPITKMSELEWDHTKPFSEGGVKQALLHTQCNRMKARGSLLKIQKTMGFKTTKTRKKKQSKPKSRRKTRSPFGISFSA